MRLRKIHAIVAVSVALVVVARSIDARRRDREESHPEPIREVPPDPQIWAEPDEPTEADPQPALDVDPSASADPSTPDATVADPDPSPDAEPSTVEVGEPTPEEPVALVAELVADEPAASESPEAAPDVSARRRWLPRGPIAIAATLLVLMAVLAGAIAAAAMAAID
jgi:hypothetical protein